MEYHEIFVYTLGRIQHIALMSRIDIFMKPVVQQTKLWQPPYLVSKASIDVFNIWLVIQIKQYFILLLIMRDQMSSELHVVGINFNTTRPRIVYNSIKVRIMLELSTEDGHFQLFFILCLVLLSSRNYIFNQIYPLNPIMEKLDSCARLSRKLRLSRDTCNPQNSTLVHQQYIGKKTQVAFLLLNLKQLLLQLNMLAFLSAFYMNNLTMFSLFQNMRSIV